jgi:hypothetical protein
VDYLLAVGQEAKRVKKKTVMKNKKKVIMGVVMNNWVKRRNKKMLRKYNLFWKNVRVMNRKNMMKIFKNNKN